MKIIHIFYALLLLTMSQAVMAHDDKYFDSHATPHGGQMRMAGPFHLELLIDKGIVTVHVTDHAGNPAPVAQLHAQAIVLNGMNKIRIDLASSEDSVLSGSNSDLLVRNDTLVMLLLKMEDGSQYQARFTPGGNLQADAAGKSYHN